jgi:peptide/nickel transport system permease protein
MKFLARRIITYVAIIFVAFNIDFFLPRLGPLTAADVFASNLVFAPQQRVLIAQRLGLNQPILTQYITNLKDIFATWPPYFGISYSNGQSVTYMFAQRLPWTLLLILSSFFLSLALALAVTTLVSLKRGGKLEGSSLYTAVSLHSIPIYWTSMVLLAVFAVSLKWFPVFGNTSFNSLSGIPYVVSVLRHAALPIIVLTLSLFGQSFLLLRGSVQEVLRNDYVQTARLRGLPNRIIAWGYVVRNSLLPFVSLSAFSVAGLVGRVIIVEVIFGYPGIGGEFTDAIENRDLPLIMGFFMLLTIIVVVGGLIGDFVLTRLDPKLRKE